MLDFDTVRTHPLSAPETTAVGWADLGTAEFPVNGVLARMSRAAVGCRTRLLLYTTVAVLLTLILGSLLAAALHPEPQRAMWTGTLSYGLTGILAAAVAVRVLLADDHKPAWTLVAASLALATVALFRGRGTEANGSLGTAGVALPFLGATGVLVIGLFVLGRSIGMSRGSWLDAMLAGAGLGSLATVASSAVHLDHVAGASSQSMFITAALTGQCLIIGGTLAVGAATGWRLQSVWGAILGSHVLGVIALATLTHSAGPGVVGGFGLARLVWVVDAIGIAIAAWSANPSAHPVTDASDVWDQSHRAGLPAAAMPAVGLFATAGVLSVLVVTSIPRIIIVPAVVASLLATIRILQAIHGAEASRQLRLLATTDELTGLANRRRLYLAAEELLARRANGTHALLLIDLNSFKEVNDTLGHPVGDALLIRLGARLSAILPTDAVLARLGGDEFAILLPDAGSTAPERLAHDVRSALKTPLTVQGHRLHVSASIGSARYPVDGATPIELLSKADMAMYTAKRAGRAFQQYSHHLENDSLDRLALLADLYVALTEGQFECCYQPKLNLQTGKVVSAEALVRWRHPTRGLLAPAAFLDLVIQSGALPSMTKLVLDQALGTASSWRDHGYDLSVAVNVGAADLLDEQLADGLVRRLNELDLPRDAMVIEVTEGAFIDAEPSERIVHLMRAHGIQIAIDDYGAGYSSLSRLRSLQADELKLDRSLVASMAVDAAAAAVVSSTVQLAHALNMRLVAEGVEDSETLELLSDLGCDEAQGFFIARPMAATDLLGWLDQRAATLVA